METLAANTLDMKTSISSHDRPVGNDPMRFFRQNYYSPGEMARMRQMVRESGTTLILPYDQFIEHDNRHVDPNPDAGSPDYICKLAEEGAYNAVAIHYGLAKRYWTKLAGSVPLLLKINGKTSIPDQSQPLSVHTSYVEDAVRMGAVAIGYTMYYGSPRQDEDLPQLAMVREECDRFGMPLVVWAYPRGVDVDAKGGKDCSYMVESAVRMATEMGATVIKANLPGSPKADFLDNADVPSYYKKVEKELQATSPKEQKWERARRVVEAAQGTPVLFSGGSEISDEDLMENAQACIDAGCFGFIFGRNMWKREWKHAMEITKEFHKMLDKA
ncbi:fructose-bisphosphate aldolase [Candidatus Peregrinibacteria bacterium]|nr:fructose-bisphosphate aldolase [Candidatus Peregrinibacteria bacterium]